MPVWVDDTESRTRRAALARVPVAERDRGSVRGDGRVQVAAAGRGRVRDAANLPCCDRHLEDRPERAVTTNAPRTDEVDRLSVRCPRGAAAVASHHSSTGAVECQRRDTAVKPPAREGDRRPVRRHGGFEFLPARPRQPKDTRSIESDCIKIAFSFEDDRGNCRRRTDTISRHKCRAGQQDDKDPRSGSCPDHGCSPGATVDPSIVPPTVARRQTNLRVMRFASFHGIIPGA